MESKVKELQDLEVQASASNFWSDSKAAEQTLKKIQFIKKQLGDFQNLNSKYDDIIVLSEFLANKELTEDEINVSYSELLKTLEDLEFKMMLNKKEDSMSAIIQITAVLEVQNLVIGLKCF